MNRPGFEWYARTATINGEIFVSVATLNEVLIGVLGTDWKAETIIKDIVNGANEAGRK